MDQHSSDQGPTFQQTLAERVFELHDLQQRTTQQLANITQVLNGLTVAVHNLQTTGTANQGQQAAEAGLLPPRDLRLNNPTPFEGRKADLRDFLTQVRVSKPLNRLPSPLSKPSASMLLLIHEDQLSGGPSPSSIMSLCTHFYLIYLPSSENYAVYSAIQTRPPQLRGSWATYDRRPPLPTTPRTSSNSVRLSTGMMQHYRFISTMA